MSFRSRTEAQQPGTSVRDLGSPILPFGLINARNPRASNTNLPTPASSPCRANCHHALQIYRMSPTHDNARHSEFEFEIEIAGQRPHVSNSNSNSTPQDVRSLTRRAVAASDVQRVECIGAGPPVRHSPDSTLTKRFNLMTSNDFGETPYDLLHFRLVERISQILNHEGVRQWKINPEAKDDKKWVEQNMCKICNHHISQMTDPSKTTYISVLRRVSPEAVDVWDHKGNIDGGKEGVSLEWLVESAESALSLGVAGDWIRFFWQKERAPEANDGAAENEVEHSNQTAYFDYPDQFVEYILYRCLEPLTPDQASSGDDRKKFSLTTIRNSVAAAMSKMQVFQLLFDARNPGFDPLFRGKQAAEHWFSQKHVKQTVVNVVSYTILNLLMASSWWKMMDEPDTRLPGAWDAHFDPLDQSLDLTIMPRGKGALARRFNDERKRDGMIDETLFQAFFTYLLVVMDLEDDDQKEVAPLCPSSGLFGGKKRYAQRLRPPPLLAPYVASARQGIETPKQTLERLLEEDLATWLTASPEVTSCSDCTANHQCMFCTRYPQIGFIFLDHIRTHHQTGKSRGALHYGWCLYDAKWYMGPQNKPDGEREQERKRRFEQRWELHDGKAFPKQLSTYWSVPKDYTKRCSLNGVLWTKDNDAFKADSKNKFLHICSSCAMSKSLSGKGDLEYTPGSDNDSLWRQAATVNVEPWADLTKWCTVFNLSTSEHYICRTTAGKHIYLEAKAQDGDSVSCPVPTLPRVANAKRGAYGNEIPTFAVRSNVLGLEDRDPKYKIWQHGEAAPVLLKGSASKKTNTKVKVIAMHNGAKDNIAYLYLCLKDNKSQPSPTFELDAIYSIAASNDDALKQLFAFHNKHPRYDAQTKEGTTWAWNESIGLDEDAQKSITEEFNCAAYDDLRKSRSIEKTAAKTKTAEPPSRYQQLLEQEERDLQDALLTSLRDSSKHAIPKTAQNQNRPPILTIQGHPWKSIPSPRDGNCLYHSLAHCQNRNRTAHDTVQHTIQWRTLKLKVMAHLSKGQVNGQSLDQWYKNPVLSPHNMSETQYNSLDNAGYVEHQSHDGMWGGTIEIWGAHEVFKTNIVVVKRVGESGYTPIYTAGTHPTTPAGWSNAWVLLYLGAAHYEALVLAH